MKILNIMLSRGLGGIEQSYIDYSKMLKVQNIEHSNISSYFAKINKMQKPDYLLTNCGSWDSFSVSKLKNIIKKESPDIIIAHGRRAAEFTLKAKNARIKVISIIHSEKLKIINKADHIISLTERMRLETIRQHIDKNKVSVLPNSIDTDSILPKYDKEFQSPPVIGAMGRLVYKKGFDVFLESLAILKKEGVQFKAILAGKGPEERNLKSLVSDFGLENFVEFTGWVKDKPDFFQKIDVFCLPSRLEPFGIVLLEAMANKVPVISANCSGPSEIIKHMKDGFLLQENSASKLAAGLEYMITQEEEAKKYAENAYIKVKDKYDTKILSKKLKNVIENLGRDQ
jgi:glycosyltransferase involved in cell wall biosynthesis